MAALDYSFIIRYLPSFRHIRSQAALSRLGHAMRWPAAAAFWGAPSALLATPSRLPRRSFGHLRQLLGNTSRRPLLYPPLIPLLGMKPYPC